MTHYPGPARACNAIGSGAFVALLVLGLCIATRFPFFFPAVISWDESTLILMGQSVLDGQLPYVELWDNKPPVAFLAYAFLLGLFGKSIVAVRIGGLLFLAGTAYLTYFTGKTIWGHRAGLLAAAFCVVFVSTASGGQATMTEIIAILPLMGALALLVAEEYDARVLFAAGILLAMAGLIRLNLAYVALFVGLYLFFKLVRGSSRSTKSGLLAYAAGGLLPLMLTATPYLFAGHGRLWLTSVFLAPLSYSGAQYSAFEALALQLAHGFAANAPLWATFLIGAARLARDWNRQTRHQKQGVMLIGVFLLATVWSIAASGAAGASHAHYLIQIVPLLSLIAGALLDYFVATRYRIAVLGLLAFGVVVLAAPIGAQYIRIAERLVMGKSLSYGAAYEIAAFLAKENPRRAPMYLMTDHIVYWLTDTKPLTRATTHPSNIAKEYMLASFAGRGASAKSEMAKVLAMKPMFIVKKKDEWYLRDKSQARQLLENELAENYVQAAEIDGRYIYRRLSGN